MATRSAKIDQKADLIWAIADKLTGVYKPHEYGDVILPLTVIRRFDCILSDTKDAVLQKYEEVKNLPMKDVLLRKVAGYDFYNISKYTFERLMDDPDHIEENFRNYLNGFSANVQDILEKFKFDGHITTMSNKGILYIVLKEYTTDRGNLHPNEISNLEMGYIFEEIIRRFSSLIMKMQDSITLQEKLSNLWSIFSSMMIMIFFPAIMWQRQFMIRHVELEVCFLLQRNIYIV